MKLSPDSPLVKSSESEDEGPTMSEGALPVASWLRPLEFWTKYHDKYLTEEDLDYTIEQE